MEPTSALLVMAGTRLLQAGVQSLAADEKLKSLDVVKQQGILAHQQKSLANLETIQKVVDSQIAQASTRGVGLGSPSLEAIERNTFNVGARQQKNLDIEEDIFKSNIAAEKSNVQSTLFAELFGESAATASDFATARSKMPTKAVA